MIPIHKNPANEPESWKAYRETPGADYAPSTDLRQALLAEQGHICAFCMRRIPLSKKDPNEAETSKIAHLLARARHPDRKFDYANMVLCCPGNINGQPHCDKSQGSADVTLPLFGPQLRAEISYGLHTGEIKCPQEEWRIQITEVLNLNTPLLRANRLQALNGVRQILETKKWTRSKLMEKLEEWNGVDRQGKLKPFCGIVGWYLQKKLG